MRKKIDRETNIIFFTTLPIFIIYCITFLYMNCYLQRSVSERPFFNGQTLLLFAVSFAAIVLLVRTAILRYAKPFREQAEAWKRKDELVANRTAALRKIAAGDFRTESGLQCSADEQDDIIKGISSTMRTMTAEFEACMTSILKGDYSIRSNQDTFEGDYRTIAQGFYKSIDDLGSSYINATEKSHHMEIKYETLRGKLLDLIEAIEKKAYEFKIDAIELNAEDAALLRRFKQAWDGILKPVQIASEYMGMIGSGEIPSEITDDRLDDFIDLRDNLNSCILSLHALKEGNDVLSKMSRNDYTERVRGDYQGIYSEISKSINAVADTTNLLVQLLYHIATGDFSIFEEKKSNSMSENDSLTPVLDLLIHNIKLLVSETNLISGAATDGHLSARGDVSKFTGEYARVIQGLNNTLDAIVQPINETLNVLKDMANGNLQTKVTGNYVGDYAVLKESLNTTLDNMFSYINDISIIMNEISEGNLDTAITAEYNGDFVEIKNSINNLIRFLRDVFEEINRAACQVASGSMQVSDASQALSQGSTEQASAIEELTTSISGIASQTKVNALNASNANELAVSAMDNAVKGNTQMKNMLESMNEINESSANISKIIKVIDDIAFQTNILALNAAVEAARAGQHGKGFAVVAEEVRNLAARSANAARETTSLIEGSVNKVQAGTIIANETAMALNEIETAIQKAADLVKDIANASHEQATGITLVNKGIEQVSSVVQSNTATAEESAAASEELSGQAELLRHMVSRFTMDKPNNMVTQSERKIMLEGPSSLNQKIIDGKY